jgi:hypothetical protein
MSRVVSVILSAFVLVQIAAFGATGTAKDTACTDEMVGQLALAGVANDLILDKINECEPHFALDPVHLIALKQAGVSDDLVRAMASKQLGRSVSPRALDRPANNLAGPGLITSPMPDEVGVYSLDRGGDLYRIEGIAVSNLRTGSTLVSALTLHIKRARINAQVNGPRAHMRLRDRQPQFYFYLPDGASIGDYLLLRLARRDDVRQIEIAERTFWKDQRGVDHAKEVDFTYKRIKPRLYLLTPSEELDSGEYGFYIAAGVDLTKASGRIYDFGID